MWSVARQIESGVLVCPITHQPLEVQERSLVTKDGSHRYPYVNGVPILFSDTSKQKAYLAEEGGGMNREYSTEPRPGGLKSLMRNMVNLDYRPEAHRAAFKKVVSDRSPKEFCLSVGGGPTREDPNLCNLNIGAFPNVDVVADAYELPYAGESVDAIYCEAVLEHLEFPDKAVAEMWRVLKKGGQVFAATPFLQWYHAYPNHFQNFTLTGQERLFGRAGFTIVSSGTSVGPTVALTNLIASYAKTFVPFRSLRRLSGWLVALMAIPVKPLDLWINRHPSSHYLASGTYVHAVKPIHTS
jgi:SAM-dependent methyltransferase